MLSLGGRASASVFSCNNAVITTNSWHGTVLLSTSSPLKPPFSPIPSGKSLIVRDRHDKRLCFYIVIVRLFLTILAVVLILSLFQVKMAVFRISEKYPFVNRNFENSKFSNIPTLLCSNFQLLRPLFLFLRCVGRLLNQSGRMAHTPRTFPINVPIDRITPGYRQVVFQWPVVAHRFGWFDAVHFYYIKIVCFCSVFFRYKIYLTVD